MTEVSGWTLEPDAGSGPALRNSVGMAYDEARGVTVLFGGVDVNAYSDTWEWDGGSWSYRTDAGPAPRYGHGMTYDAARGRTVTFAGVYNAETWE